MGTISLPYTFVAGQTPTATQWNSNPTTIATLVNGQIDKANVDSAGTDGIVTMDETQTISGAKTFSGAVINTGGITVKDVDNAAGSIQTNLTLEWDPADGNNLTDNTSGIGIDFKMPDDADNQDVFASLNVMCVSDATTTENGEFSFKVMTDGTNSEVMTLQSTLGAAGTVLTLATAEPTVVDGDVLGRIDFQAPSEGSGTDAILVGASIYAEADDTFASGLNDTDLVFAVAESETAAERMRLSYDGTTTDLNFAGVANISSGGDITLSATGDVNLPADIGLTFGDDGEKIEGDGTNLTIASSAQVIVTPTTDTIFTNGTGVVVGHTAQMTAGGVTPEMQILGTGAADSQLLLGRFSDDASGPVLVFTKSQGAIGATHGSDTLVADNDNIGAIYATLDDGTDLAQIAASINFVVDDASPAANATGASIEFHTMNASGTSRNVASINNDGAIQVPNASGDTITQITAESTWVGVLSASGGNHVNSNVTLGVTVNQGGADDSVLSFKSSDVAHGITARAETDTYMNWGKNASATGGAMCRTFTENKQSFGVLAYYTTDDTAKTTSADGPIALWTHKKSGTSSAAPGSNANQLVVGDYSNGAQFIVDAEGDLHANGSATTVYDDRDDMALLSAFDRDSKGFIEQDWERNLSENEKALIDIGILGGPRVNVPAKERGLINYTGLARLHNSALRQVYTQLVETVKRLDLAESKLKMLGA